jgi:hypothetical protein
MAGTTVHDVYCPGDTLRCTGGISELAGVGAVHSPHVRQIEMDDEHEIHHPCRACAARVGYRGGSAGAARGGGRADPRRASRPGVCTQCKVDAACPVSTGVGTRRVRLVRGEGGEGVPTREGVGRVAGRKRLPARLASRCATRSTGEGREVSGQYGRRDETCPLSTGGEGGGGC